MQWHHFFPNGENNTVPIYCACDSCELFPLFYHWINWITERSVPIAISAVVNKMDFLPPSNISIAKKLNGFYSLSISVIVTDDVRLPIEWKTPIRYSIVVIVEYLFAIYPIFFAATVICFAIGIYFNALLFAERISAMLQEFGENAKTQVTNQMQYDFKILAKYHECHSSVRQ